MEGWLRARQMGMGDRWDGFRDQVSIQSSCGTCDCQRQCTLFPMRFCLTWILDGFIRIRDCEVHAFVEEARERRFSIICHCRAGCHRAGAMVCILLVMYLGLTPGAGFRPIRWPHPRLPDPFSIWIRDLFWAIRPGFELCFRRFDLDSRCVLGDSTWIRVFFWAIRYGFTCLASRSGFEMCVWRFDLVSRCVWGVPIWIRSVLFLGEPIWIHV